MENMCAVFVHMDPLYIFTVDISGNMAAFVDHKTTFPFLRQFVCHHRAI